MSATQTLCTVFKLNLLQGLENFNPSSANVYKIALYTANSTLNASSLLYTTVNEIVGTGYIAGGMTLTKVLPMISGTTAYITFPNVVWAPAAFTTNSALIYNAATQAAVAILNFGSDKTCISTFTVTFPVADATNAIIRLA